ncbi:hypothetical protein B0J13DRAFT_592248 [Dactylonectria estremocensis]|uniref:Nucleoside phosphorylase domain-containing protein n=1 Tax=Dactylonectria estremocensis TaxID=1079267 RepID=A0A9P9FAZ5_9HYPO|nr:hypothetical protein B0J13DRAFT_592248 [Dactylonectria estremocensis]
MQSLNHTTRTTENEGPVVDASHKNHILALLPVAGLLGSEIRYLWIFEPVATSYSPTFHTSPKGPIVAHAQAWDRRVQSTENSAGNKIMYSVDTTCRVGKHNVIIAVLPDGEEGTSYAASIGGGALTKKHDIRLGDVVVSAPRDGKGGVFQYDFGKTVQDQVFRLTGFLNHPPIILRTAANGLKARYEIDGHQLETSIETILENKPRLRKKYQRPQENSDRVYRSGVIHPRNNVASCVTACGSDASSLVLRPERTMEEDNLIIHYGLIASANHLMNDALVRDVLASEKGILTNEGGIAGNEVLCFEKEAAGLMNHFPCLVIRGICDYSDSHANMEWQGYAAMAAASYAKDLLYRIPPKKINAERTINHILADVQGKITDVSTSVGRLLSIQNDQKHQTILDWLTPINYASQQHDFLSRRQTGTGRWFLDSHEYRAWLEIDGQTLFCQGIPGSGKTIMTSLVVEDLLGRVRSGGFHDDRAEGGSAGGSIGIAYLYCNFRRQHEQQAEDLLASLLKQLVKGHNCLPQNVQELYDRHKADQTRPDFDEISSALKSVISIHSRVFIIVDALDECQALNKCRSRANFFATSRPMLDIEKRFDGCFSRHIFANDEDIGMYINGHISQLPDFVSKRPSLQEEVKRGIIKAVGGMFLLAQLHLDSLVGKRSPAALRATLEKLPTGSEAYPEAYKEAMLRIGRQVGDQEELAKQALAWITCAKRPLTTVELQHGLAIRAGDSKLDGENVSEIEDIVSVCAGLVTVDRESDIVQLFDITTICITYLSFTAFETGFCEVEEEYQGRLRSNQLYCYAARYWGYHSLSATRDVKALILHFLQSRSNMSASIQVIMPDRDDYCFHNCLYEPTETSGIHLTAYFGLLNTIEHLLETGQHADYKDSHGRTPLWLAAKEGHDKVVSLLLENGADPDPNDHDQRTPLDEAIFKLLIERGADLESRDGEGWSPLSRAVGRGHEAIVKLLVERGVDLESRDGDGSSPLSCAVRKGYDAIVKLLIEKGADLEPRDKVGWTSLTLAIYNGDRSIAKLLIEGGADLESRGRDGMSPLFSAIERGYMDIVKLLIEGGVDMDLEDAMGQTALSLAFKRDREAAVQLLLEKGANPAWPC